MANYNIEMNSFNGSTYDMLYPKGFLTWNDSIISVINTNTIKNQIKLDVDMRNINTVLFYTIGSTAGQYTYSFYENINTNRTSTVFTTTLAKNARVFIYLTAFHYISSSQATACVVAVMETEEENLSSVYIEYALLDITNNSFYVSYTGAQDIIMFNTYVI